MNSSLSKMVRLNKKQQVCPAYQIVDEFDGENFIGNAQADVGVHVEVRQVMKTAWKNDIRSCRKFFKYFCLTLNSNFKSKPWSLCVMLFSQLLRQSSILQ